MRPKSKLKRSRGDGYERIEWLDARGRTQALRDIDAAAALAIQPNERVRTIPKWQGQRSYQGHYWCAGTQSLVFHESMVEYAALMLLDHLHDITAVHAQPMLLCFDDDDNTIHYPDYMVETAHRGRMLIDAHVRSLTTDADRNKFDLTRDMCSRLGWGYELLFEMTQVTFWNLEMLARYRHPRYNPTAAVRERIRISAAAEGSFGGLRRALRTDKPGEHMPAFFNMMWGRELTFDLTAPFTDDSVIYAD